MSADDLPDGITPEMAIALVVGPEALQKCSVLIIYQPTDPPKPQEPHAIAPEPTITPRRRSLPSNLLRLALRCNVSLDRLEKGEGIMATELDGSGVRIFESESQAITVLSVRAEVMEDAARRKAAELDPPVGVRLPPLH